MYVGDLTCPPYTKHVTTQAFLLHQREERRQRAEVLKLVKSWEMLGSMDRDQDGEVRCVVGILCRWLVWSGFVLERV